MKRPAILLSLLLACTGATAKTTPDHEQVHGEWSGRGDTVGQAFSACAKFSPYMNGAYLHLDYAMRYDTAGAMPNQMTESFYTFLDNGRVEGVSLDSLSNVLQLNGTYADHRMNVDWLKNGKTIGKAEWRLSADGNTLTFVRFGEMGGQFKEIGEVKMNRLPAGKSCSK
jgi:hypothetical protein